MKIKQTRRSNDNLIGPDNFEKKKKNHQIHVVICVNLIINDINDFSLFENSLHRFNVTYYSCVALPNGIVLMGNVDTHFY